MPITMFDREALHRAVLNVVTNAIDACGDLDTGHVDIASEYKPADRLALVRVSDSGSGIEKEDLDKIFTVFVSRKGGRGTGLGLPVSQKIMQEHGGRIRVESTPGQGSTFTLELPTTSPPVSETSETSAEDEASEASDRPTIHS